MPKSLTLYSWNVNGLRAVLRKGALQDFLEKYSPDILCLQEIKSKPEQIDFDFSTLGYTAYFTPAERPGYSGTGILVKNGADLAFFNVSLGDFLSEPPERHRGNCVTPEAKHFSETYGAPRASTRRLSPVTTGRENAVFGKVFCGGDTGFPSLALSEGRITCLDLGDFYLISVYTPNSKDDLSRLELRETSWDPELLDFVKSLEREKPVIFCGDLNAAHEEIDLARPDSNHHSAGFTDEERRGITNIIEAGFIDTFRHLHPYTKGYSWWSYRGRARENNVGWRIDYFFISSELSPALKKAEIHGDITGSDHCPISITLEF